MFYRRFIPRHFVVLPPPGTLVVAAAMMPAYIFEFLPLFASLGLLSLRKRFGWVWWDDCRSTRPGWAALSSFRFGPGLFFFFFA